MTSGKDFDSYDTRTKIYFAGQILFVKLRIFIEIMCYPIVHVKEHISNKT